MVFVFHEGGKLSDALAAPSSLAAGSAAAAALFGDAAVEDLPLPSFSLAGEAGVAGAGAVTVDEVREGEEAACCCCC